MNERVVDEPAAEQDEKVKSNEGRSRALALYLDGEEWLEVALDDSHMFGKWRLKG